MSDTERNWSIVMRGLTGRYLSVSELVCRIYGAKGGCLLGLAFYSDEDLPSELECGLSLAEAEDRVELLRIAGVDVEAAATDEIGAVKHRSHEIWPNRCATNYCFTEIDGLLTTEQPISARRWLVRMRREKPDGLEWEMESFLNHTHVGSYGDLTVMLQEGLDIVSRLETDLMEAYPELSFIVSYSLPSIVSFYQARSDCPREDYLLEADGSGTAWCIRCGGSRAVTPDHYVDPRFPLAKWGICHDCKDRVLASKCVKLFTIGPAR